MTAQNGCDAVAPEAQAGDLQTPSAAELQPAAVAALLSRESVALPNAPLHRAVVTTGLLAEVKKAYDFAMQAPDVQAALAAQQVSKSSAARLGRVCAGLFGLSAAGDGALEALGKRWLANHAKHEAKMKGLKSSLKASLASAKSRHKGDAAQLHAKKAGILAKHEAACEAERSKPCSISLQDAPKPHAQTVEAAQLMLELSTEPVAPTAMVSSCTGTDAAAAARAAASKQSPHVYSCPHCSSCKAEAAAARARAEAAEQKAIIAEHRQAQLAGDALIARHAAEVSVDAAARESAQSLAAAQEGAARAVERAAKEAEELVAREKEIAATQV